MPALEQLGGKVLAYRFYDPAATDFTAQIQRLLLLDESRARHRALSAYLGVATEFEPRRRGDIDFIFLAANVASGRLIRPQLRFLYAGDIPTYATSAIYAAGSDGDADLDGVRFPDAPALIGSDSRAVALRAALERRRGAGAVSLMRFYAMGYDAYTLSEAVESGAVDGIFGLSGMLSLDADRRIHRRMPWAEFRNGRIVSLPDAPDPGLPPPADDELPDEPDELADDLAPTTAP
jgi:outer membrane PBP1 activator LpoA protein